MKITKLEWAQSLKEKMCLKYGCGECPIRFNCEIGIAVVRAYNNIAIHGIG